jgi:hypothetical protein
MYPPQKFICGDIIDDRKLKSINVGVLSMGMMFMSISLKICVLVKKLLGVDKHMHAVTCRDMMP